MPNRPRTHRVSLPRSSSSKERARFYATEKWKRLRVIILKRDPQCVICGERASKPVDHIDDNYMNNDLSNLRGLCASCHSRRTLHDLRNPQPIPEPPPPRTLPDNYRFV